MKLNFFKFLVDFFCEDKEMFKQVCECVTNESPSHSIELESVLQSKDYSSDTWVRRCLLAKDKQGISDESLNEFRLEMGLQNVIPQFKQNYLI